METSAQQILEPVQPVDLIDLTNHLVQSNIQYLAISVGIILALGIVFSIFNLSPLRKKLSAQEKEIKGLKEDAKAILDEARDEVTSSIESFRLENEERVEEEYSRIRLESENNLKTIKNNLTEKINDISSAQKDILLEVNNSLSDIKAKAKEMKLDITELMAFKYQSEGKMGGIILMIKWLESVIEDGNFKHPGMRYILEDLEKRIKNETLEEKYADRLKEVIKSLKENNWVDKDKILSKVEDCIEKK